MASKNRVFITIELNMQVSYFFYMFNARRMNTKKPQKSKFRG